MHDANQSALQTERRLRKLFELSRRLVVTLNLDDILQATVEGVSALAELDTAAVYLIEDGALRLLSTTPPLPQRFPDELRYALLDDHPHIRKAIESSAPVFIADVTAVSLTRAEKSVVEQRNLRSLLFLPLIAETEVMGALIVGSTGAASPLASAQIDLSHTLANYAALAVKNARLYQAGQRYAAQLEKTLDERKQAEAEREKLRELLIQSQKMDAIGQLAGGIAHDFNNLLCGIMGNAELLCRTAMDEESRQLANDIITISKRSADLTSQLLAFSRKGPVQVVAVDLHQLVQEVISILRHTISRTIRINTVLEADPCRTKGDPTQIQSAILNLAVNARDAMPEGGSLDIHTRCVELDADYCRGQTFNLVPGRYIELTIADTGVGMDEATLNRIYEPFFTTKKRGEGTGMGLSAVYGTMITNGGSISAESKPGHGATFKLYFPTGEEVPIETGAQHAATSVPSSNSADYTAVQKILVIDDEEMIVKIASRRLAQAGYEVETYTDSVAALSFFEKDHSAVSLIILDMIMPKMDGPAMYRAIKAIDPLARVILVSGFSIDSAAQNLLSDGAQSYIQKPYLLDDLVRAVRNALQIH
jgi:signal transduction histidine kinase/ActR/RegA family two-component response regulator